MLDKDIPALSRKVALEAAGGHLDSSRDLSSLRKQVVAIPLKVNRKGRYILSAVDLRKVRGPVVSASQFEWAFTNRRPNLPVGRLPLPYAEDGLARLRPAKPFSWGTRWVVACRVSKRLS